MQKTNELIRDLGDGLILRRSRRQDAEALAQFNAAIHGEDEMDAVRLAAWTKDLLRGNHPTFGEGDFTVVEDTNSGKIVSSCNLISQTWQYEDVPFKVGRPELVGTDPDYRKRGLVRAQFDVLHAWSKERGEVLQAITGIPYYYRQFGYEMAMNLGGARLGFTPHLPKLEKDQQETHILRLPVESDLPFMAELYRQGCQRSLVSCVRDEATWHYEVFGKDPENVNGLHFRVIENAAGERVGYLAQPGFNWYGGRALVACEFEIIPGVSWLEVSKAVVRYLWEAGRPNAEKSQIELSGFGFRLHPDHPVFTVLEDRLPRDRKPYAWYLRLPDVAGFLRLIQPVLNTRLANSAFNAYSGKLEISFYRSGVYLVFEQGKITEIGNWQPAPKSEGQAAFPNLTFLHLLFGYRTLDEVMHIYPDCWAEEEAARGLLRVLFPQKHSYVQPVS